MRNFFPPSPPESVQTDVGILTHLDHNHLFSLMAKVGTVNPVSICPVIKYMTFITQHTHSTLLSSGLKQKEFCFQEETGGYFLIIPTSGIM